MTISSDVKNALMRCRSTNDSVKAELLMDALLGVAEEARVYVDENPLAEDVAPLGTAVTELEKWL